MNPAVEETLTALEHALWVIDHAVIIDRPPLDERGRPDPAYRPAAPRPMLEVMEEAIRPSKRGVTRVGLTARLWLALLLLAARNGHATIANMHKIATGNLPREMQWQLGILTRDPLTGAPRTLTAKQLYGLTEKITEHLDINPAWIPRPGLNASADELAVFTRKVQERQLYAMTRIQTAWQNNDGKTRWRCAAKNGTRKQRMPRPTGLGIRDLALWRWRESNPRPLM
jgi:hypothetical protein